jgi:hypothetical protein
VTTTPEQYSNASHCGGGLTSLFSRTLVSLPIRTAAMGQAMLGYSISAAMGISLLPEMSRR